MGGREYLGEFELVVLLALARLGKEAYGASIHSEILEATGRDVSIPAVYVTLKRMDRKGLVASSLGQRTGSGGRATRNYRLLPEGREAMSRSRSLVEGLWSGHSPRRLRDERPTSPVCEDGAVRFRARRPGAPARRSRRAVRGDRERKGSRGGLQLLAELGR